MTTGSSPGGPAPRRRGEAGEHLLGEALDTFLRAQGYGQASALATISSCWTSVVGDDVAAHVTPRSLRDTTLIVSVDQPLWATQVAFLAEELLAALAVELGAGVVEHLEATVRVT